MQAILDTAEKAKRDISAEEKTKFDELRNKAKEIGDQIARMEAIDALEGEADKRNQPGRDGISDHLEPQGEHKMIDGFKAADLQRYSLLRAINCLATGSKLDGVEGELNVEFAKRYGKASRGNGFLMPNELPLGEQQVRNVLNSFEKRTLVNTTTGTGAVATVLDVANFIDILRNRLCVIPLGATVLSGLTSNVSIPKQTQAGTAAWVSEGSAPATSNQVIGSVSLTPTSLMAFTDISRRFLIQSSVSAEAFVRNDLAQVMALEADRAAINGSGASNQPTGILQDTNIPTSTVAADAGNGGACVFADTVAMETTVAAANADYGTLAYLTTPKCRGKLKTTLVASAAGSRMVWENNEINGYRAFASNQVPSNLVKGTSGSICSAMIFGNWASLVLAMFGVTDVLVDPYTGSSAGTVRVNTYQDMNVAFRHEESFVKFVDILTT